MFSEEIIDELLPGLPDDLALDCLTRLHHTAHRLAGGVCPRWRHLLQSTAFYYHRQRTGHTRKAACLVQALPVRAGESDGRKPVRQPRFGMSVFDPISGTWDRIEPVPKYPDGLPLFCQVASSEGKLVVMGGWNPLSYDPVKDVFVYEFVTRRWTQRKDMPSQRMFFAAAAVDGRVFVAGGHDTGKNALRTGWVYDIRTDEWAELPPMLEERDECQGIVIGSEFWVVSGYETESQGRFKSTAESFEIETGQWRRVEGAWRTGQCPRSCVGVGKDGGLICLAESDPEIRVGTCWVEVGERAVAVGLPHQSAAHGFYTIETKEGQRVKLVKMDVADEFSGYAQSGCCVEI